MIYPIVIYGAQTLRNKSVDITPDYPDLKKLIDDMFLTLDEASGVGLAAPQVTYIMHALKKKGLDVDVNATTIEEATREILKALK